jgi:hypothetical protein
MTTLRRICWPDPDATCLEGGCGYCNDHPFRAVESIRRYAAKRGTLVHRGNGLRVDALAAFRYGMRSDWNNAESRG